MGATMRLFTPSACKGNLLSTRLRAHHRRHRMNLTFRYGHRLIRCASTLHNQATVNPRNVWCVGRNYVEHAKELGNEVPETPMIFLKAGSCVVPSGTALTLPSFSKDLHHEVELAIELGDDLEPSRAAVSLDLTARDLQNSLRKAGHPWTLAKSFPQACPVGTAFQVTEQLDWKRLQMTLEINGQLKQSTGTDLMVHSIPKLLAYVKQHFPVCPGDLILTGTPKGVGPIKPGDRLVARISSGQECLSEGVWTVVPPS